MAGRFLATCLPGRRWASWVTVCSILSGGGDRTECRVWRRQYPGGGRYRRLSHGPNAQGRLIVWTFKINFRGGESGPYSNLLAVCCFHRDCSDARARKAQVVQVTVGQRIKLCKCCCENLTLGTCCCEVRTQGRKACGKGRTAGAGVCDKCHVVLFF